MWMRNGKVETSCRATRVSLRPYFPKLHNHHGMNSEKQETQGNDLPIAPTNIAKAERPELVHSV